MAASVTSDQLKKLTEAETLADKGKLYFEHGRFEESRDFYQKALEKRIEALDNSDPLVAETHHRLAVSLGELGEYEMAGKNFDKAVEIFEKFYYSEHYNLAPVLLDQASFLMRQEKWEEAEPICLRSQQIFSKTLSGENKLCLESTYRLAIIYRKIGKGADALKLFARIKKALESPLGPEEEFNYLEALLKQDEGKPNEAEKAFLAAIKGFEKRRNLVRLADCLKSYAELLKAQNKSDEALQILEKASKIENNSKGLSYSGALFTTTLLKA